MINATNGSTLSSNATVPATLGELPIPEIEATSGFRTLAGMGNGILSSASNQNEAPSSANADDGGIVLQFPGRFIRDQLR